MPISEPGYAQHRNYVYMRPESRRPRSTLSIFYVFLLFFLYFFLSFHSIFVRLRVPDTELSWQVESENWKETLKWALI